MALRGSDPSRFPLHSPVADAYRILNSVASYNLLKNRMPVSELHQFWNTNVTLYCLADASWTSSQGRRCYGQER